MSTTLLRDTGAPLIGLIEDIRTGRLALPDIQRPFVWASKGVSLNQADFILTLMSVHWEKGRRQLEEFSRAATDPTIKGTTPKNPFIEPSPDQMLRVAVALAFRRARLQFVYNILRGKDLDTGTVSLQRRDEQFSVLAAAQAKVLDLGNWHEFLKCLQTAGFRSRKTISSDNALLFSYALWLVGRIDFGLDLPTLRTSIARWFFMAHTTGRYTSSPESALEFDLGRIADLPAGDGLARTLSASSNGRASSLSQSHCSSSPRTTSRHGTSSGSPTSDPTSGVTFRGRSPTPRLLWPRSTAMTSRSSTR